MQYINRKVLFMIQNIIDFNYVNYRLIFVFFRIFLFF